MKHVLYPSPALLPVRLYGRYIIKLDICLLGLGALTSLGWMSVFAKLATGFQEPSQLFSLKHFLRLDY